ncbi:MAG: hypothetical protein IKT40_06260 [Bacilli bacterium]|nr:hypothetical protein [Bacilli bacterium]
MKLEQWTKNMINLIYKVNDVQQGFFYWQALLTDIVVDMIEYKDLDIPTLSDEQASEEIEYRRVTMGQCSFLDHPRLGIMPCNSRLFNYDLYGNFENVLFFNPYKDFLKGYTPKTHTIGKDAVVIYDSSTQKKLYAPIQGKNIIMQKINRTARKLADIEATINMYTINARQPYIITTRNQQTQQSFLDVFKKLKRGEFFIGLDKDIIKEATSLKNAEITTGFITELYDQHKAVLKEFLMYFGFYTTEDKEERMINAEIENENKKDKVFAYSFLKAAEQGIMMYNIVFNKNASVSLRVKLYNENDLYDYNVDDIEIKDEYKAEEVVSDEN